MIGLTDKVRVTERQTVRAREIKTETKAVTESDRVIERDGNTD